MEHKLEPQLDGTNCLVMWLIECVSHGPDTGITQGNVYTFPYSVVNPLYYLINGMISQYCFSLTA